MSSRSPDPDARTASRGTDCVSGHGLRLGARTARRGAVAAPKGSPASQGQPGEPRAARRAKGSPASQGQPGAQDSSAQTGPAAIPSATLIAAPTRAAQRAVGNGENAPRTGRSLARKTGMIQRR